MAATSAQKSRRRGRVAKATAQAPSATPAIGAAEQVAPATRAGAPTGPGWRRALGAVEGVAMAGALAAAAAGVLGDYTRAGEDLRVLPGVRLGGSPVGGLDAAGLRTAAASAAEEGLVRPLELVAGEVRVAREARALGAVASPEDAIAAALAVGHSGDLFFDLQERAAAERGAIDLRVGYRFEARAALVELLALAPSVERPSLPTRFDWQRRVVAKARPGASLLPFDSLSAVAIGLASGADRIELVTQARPPVADPLATIADELAIGAVLGSFSTRYHNDNDHADRNHNVKLGAQALDGQVLMPGETFSFNAVVGERSDEAGYRYAPGITAGELVDVVGGGTCQVSSTLYGAAFFAGLDLVHARPHSRPSSYIDMGLDSTVVYGAIDMKLRNPYDFPVVLHSVVSAGEVKIEVLGKERPYKVAFERELKEVLPFKTVVRDDPRLRVGASEVAQQGKRGFKVVRRRKLIADEAVVRTEEWELNYPPTTQIVRRGSSPNGAPAAAPPPPPLRDPAAQLRIVQ